MLCTDIAINAFTTLSIALHTVIGLSFTLSRIQLIDNSLALLSATAKPDC
jgi:hypothetical protein